MNILTQTLDPPPEPSHVSHLLPSQHSTYLTNMQVLTERLIRDGIGAIREHTTTLARYYDHLPTDHPDRAAYERYIEDWTGLIVKHAHTLLASVVSKTGYVEG